MSVSRKFCIAFWLAAVLLFGAVTRHVAGRAVPQAAVIKPLVAMTSYRLANGLRVVLAPNHAVPVLGLCVAYGVGSVDEHPGQAGLAHLCEHLMSQGSAHVGRDESRLLIQETGGSQNASTTQDETSYYETLPSDQLDLSLFLEADRMGSLEITQSGLNNQRAVVKAEKRERHDDLTYRDLQQTILRLGYTEYGYGHPAIGDNADLDGVTLSQARAFFQAHYMPDNAVLALAGDFDTGVAETLIMKRFGPIPARALPARPETAEPPFLTAGHVALTDHYNSLPCYEIAYRTPPLTHPDDAPLALLSDILGKGRSCRLGTALVEPQRAIAVSASLRDRHGPGLFVIWATLPPRTSFGPVARTIDATLTQVQTLGVTNAELQKAKAQERAVLTYGLYSAQSRARELASDVIQYGDAGEINRELPKLDAVTAADVQRVARHYLSAGHRIAVTVVPYNDARASIF